MSAPSIHSYNTIKHFHETSQKLRGFFLERGFLESDTQSRRSILAACEQPETIATYHFSGVKWPLPQTGQMWLEYDLLTNPDIPGFFCHTTSYRDEPHPNPARHLTQFPLFEFETKGTMQDLQKLLEDLFEYLDLGKKETFRAADYSFLANYYGVKELESEHEMKAWHDFSSVFLLKNFPLYTSPFFNMKKEGNTAKKIDAILCGIETVGSAERACDPDEMREMFYTISNGGYAAKLFEHFGRERVEKELNEFLSLDFFPRFGGGIGMTRLMRAVSLSRQERTGIMFATGARTTTIRTKTV